MTENNSLSIEFFPPKTPEGAEKLRAVRQALYPLKPQFCSVTYGAGGSTQAGTISTLKEILSEGMSAASHFSCIGATRDSVRQQLAEFKATKRLTPMALNSANCWRTLSRVAPMHEKCEAADMPSLKISFNVEIVPACVEPPAP